jgi:hypothetical protein
MDSEEGRYSIDQAQDEAERLTRQVDKQWVGSYAEAEANIPLLDMINAKVAELGSTAQWMKAPESHPEYASLAGKTVVMVDDSDRVLQNYVPDLMKATDGKAQFILYTDQTSGGLAQKILAANADIILMDYNLSETLKGATVAGILKDRGFSGVIVGFSSEKSYQEEFQRSGKVDMIIPKGDAEDSVLELAKRIPNS